MSPASAARRHLECLVRRCLAPARGFCAVSQATHQPERQTPSPPSPSSEELINLEYQHSAHNYHPIPMVFSQAKGTCVWDPEGNKYIDFLSAYSAVNQGHCHPKVMKALVDQAERLTLSSRAFYNDKFPLFAELLTHMFGYEMMLPMNTGAEGVETALKLARKWGYEKKSIPKDEAIIVSCCGCFHGRTLAVVSMSCDNDAACGFGPLLPGHMKVDFGDIDALEKIFKEHGDKIAAFLFEPIQGEAGKLEEDGDKVGRERGTGERAGGEGGVDGCWWQLGWMLALLRGALDIHHWAWRLRGRQRRGEMRADSVCPRDAAWVAWHADAEETNAGMAAA